MPICWEVQAQDIWAIIVWFCWCDLDSLDRYCLDLSKWNTVVYMIYCVKKAFENDRTYQEPHYMIRWTHKIFIIRSNKLMKLMKWGDSCGLNTSEWIVPFANRSMTTLLRRCSQYGSPRASCTIQGFMPQASTSDSSYRIRGH